MDDSSPPPFLNLHVSLPNGLILDFDFEDSAGERFFIDNKLEYIKFMHHKVLSIQYILRFLNNFLI